MSENRKNSSHATFAERWALRTESLIRRVIRVGTSSITKRATSTARSASGIVQFWLRPYGRPAVVFTAGFIAVCLLASVGHALFRFRTTALTIHMVDRAHGCPECLQGEWRVTGTRKVAEGLYSYATDPGCKMSSSPVEEIWTFVRMIALAPTTLLVGTVVEANNLEVVKSIRSSAISGTWLGKQLAGNINATAECAVLAVPIPIGSKLHGESGVVGRSTNPSVSTLGVIPENRKVDGPALYGCPTDGGSHECGGDYGSFARLNYKPTENDPIGNYSVIHTVIKNWYREDGFFHTNPREFTLSVVFLPPSGWSPNERDFENSIRAVIQKIFREDIRLVSNIN
jgi:hypothetical protein